MPNTLFIGTSFNITWNFPDVIGNVKIEVSRDNGSTWNTIIASVYNWDGIVAYTQQTYPWTVTGPLTYIALIKISGLTYTDPVDQSVTDFTNVIAISNLCYILPNSSSFFSSGTVADGNAIISTVNNAFLVNLIQSYVSDPYFNSTSELYEARIYYTHIDGRQKKMIRHILSNGLLSGSVFWVVGAHDGTWQKTKIKVFDTNGASVQLSRAIIGTNEDLSHSLGVMTLNT